MCLFQIFPWSLAQTLFLVHSPWPFWHLNWILFSNINLSWLERAPMSPLEFSVQFSDSQEMCMICLKISSWRCAVWYSAKDWANSNAIVAWASSLCLFFFFSSTWLPKFSHFNCLKLHSLSLLFRDTAIFCMAPFTCFAVLKMVQ